jgi:hypothetical protein
MKLIAPTASDDFDISLIYALVRVPARNCHFESKYGFSQDPQHDKLPEIEKNGRRVKV